MRLLSLQATLMSWLKTSLGLCAQVICKPFSAGIPFLFLWGISNQKQLLHHLFLPSYVLGTVWMWIIAFMKWCFELPSFILQYFPPPNVYIIPQSHYPSAHPSVQFSVTLLQNMIIKASLIIITNSLLSLALPLSNAYWQGWNGNDGLSWLLPINLAHLRLGSSAQKFNRRWSLCSGFIQLPMDLPQLPDNLCGLMDTIIPYVHSREEAWWRWQSQDGLDAASSVYLRSLSSVCGLEMDVMLSPWWERPAELCEPCPCGKYHLPSLYPLISYSTVSSFSTLCCSSDLAEK